MVIVSSILRAKKPPTRGLLLEPTQQQLHPPAGLAGLPRDDIARSARLLTDLDGTVLLRQLPCERALIEASHLPVAHEAQRAVLLAQYTHVVARPHREN